MRSEGQVDVRAGKPVAQLALPASRNGRPPGVDLPLHRRMDTSFLQYASYVIRDRAIPNLADGLKPVQRRILWALREKDDGKFIKVQNVVGHAMQYHPHGDVSISVPISSKNSARRPASNKKPYGPCGLRMSCSWSTTES